MADGSETALSNVLETALATSTAMEASLTTSDNVLRALDDVVRELPSHVIKDLVSIGVCFRCIFRLFGIQGHIYCFPSICSSISNFLREPTDVDKSRNTCKEPDVELPLCSLCLGILQFTYSDDKDKLVKNEGPDNLAVSIAEIVKKEGHQITNFSLEVSIPPMILDNEQSVWLYLKKKYGSESWFQGKSISLCLSVKEALKSSVTKLLETLLHSKSSISHFCIRLIYSHPKASKRSNNSKARLQDCKRRKTDTEYSLKPAGDSSAAIDRSDVSMSQPDADILYLSQANESSECFSVHTAKIHEPCLLAVSCNSTPIYFVGRYLKYSRNVSQTRWIIDDERMGEASVEEILGNNILPLCCGDNYKFHAAGREDIDVRMLGSGRPFLVEVQNPRHILSEIDVKEMEKKINNMDKKLVGVKNLKVVGSEGWALMRDGEAEKQKQYAALVWISRPLEDKDFHSLTSLKDIQVFQRTPIRVLHRRSPLEREKIIHWMKIEKVVGRSQYFLLHLCTQAGTYIKEFVHGDLGRTHPSIGSILGCRAEILQLDVTDVKMDSFLTE